MIPEKYIEGTTVEAVFELPDHPASEGWTVTVIARGVGPYDVVAIADGDKHVILMPTDMPAGDYWYQVFAEKGALKHMPLEGQFTVQPNLSSQAAGYDGRTEAKKALDAINAVLAKKATTDQKKYKINNRELERMSVGELQKLRSFFVMKVRRENGKAARRRIEVRC